MINAGLMMFLPSALLGLGLTVMLILYLGLKRDFRSQVQKQETHIEQLSAQMTKLTNTAPSVPAATPEPPRKPQLPRSSLNISTRIQAMRMLRNGEDAPQIAAALRIPRGEAELLVRMHHLRFSSASRLRHAETTN